MPQAPGAEPSLIPSTIRRAITALVVHCSATPSGRFLPGGAAPLVIDRWHAQRGFRRAEAARQAFNDDLPHIGYHFVVDLDGRVWTGRHVEELGAHARGFNAISLGICLVGGAEPMARYTAEQWAALQLLVVQLQLRCLGARVVGHRDLSPDANGDGEVTASEWLKTCPGFDVATWLANSMQPFPGQIVRRA